MTERRVPAVMYSTPFTMMGVASSLYSGRVPRLSVLKRHATSSLLKLPALIWSSGEYLLPWRSAVYIGHSPFCVLGRGLVCPRMAGASHARPAPSTSTAAADFRNIRAMSSPAPIGNLGGHDRRTCRFARDFTPAPLVSKRKTYTTIRAREDPAGRPNCVG